MAGNKPASWVGPLRSVVKGATFAFGDEIEGLGRMLLSGQISREAYQQQVDRIRAQQVAYEQANPLESVGYEMGGAFLPALIPGGQGIAGARMASLAAKAPGVGRAASFAVRNPRAAEMARIGAESAAYGVGAADSMREAPASIGEEAAFGYGLYAAPRGLRAGYRRVRGKK